jgi:hypothetical protein
LKSKRKHFENILKHYAVVEDALCPDNAFFFGSLQIEVRTQSYMVSGTVFWLQSSISVLSARFTFVEDTRKATLRHSRS